MNVRCVGGRLCIWIRILGLQVGRCEMKIYWFPIVYGVYLVERCGGCFLDADFSYNRSRLHSSVYVYLYLKLK